MRTLTEGLAQSLASGATTLCHCWRVRRRDGVVLGFTDHDRALEFDGTRFEAASGWQASEVAAGLGLAVDNHDVAGALASGSVSEADILAGRYDGARIETFVVDWASPQDRVSIFTGSIGEVSRSGGAFVAEMRGLSQELSEVRGRLFGHLCDAELGDGRCGVDTQDPALRGAGTVTEALDDRTVIASGLPAFEGGWFRGGRLVWSSGANAGLAVSVADHRREDAGTRLALRESVAGIETGDTFSVAAGCDKRFATCREKFANQANFRGFPHMPGNDFALSYPTRGDGRNRGRSLNR